MLDKLNQIYPVRYTVFIASVVLLVFTLLGSGVLGMSGWWPLIFLGLSLIGLYDLQQQHHAILRNYPIIGHLRFMLEYIRPEIRQYFLESETDAAPFSRAQRGLVYSRAKGVSDKRPFGTQLDVRTVGYEWINHSIAPTVLSHHDFRISVGGCAVHATLQHQFVQCLGHELWRAQCQRHHGVESRRQDGRLCA